MTEQERNKWNCSGTVPLFRLGAKALENGTMEHPLSIEGEFRSFRSIAGVVLFL